MGEQLNQPSVSNNTLQSKLINGGLVVVCGLIFASPLLAPTGGGELGVAAAVAGIVFIGCAVAGMIRPRLANAWVVSNIVLMALLGGLGLIAVGMAVNAQGIYDPTADSVVPGSRLWTSGPGAPDRLEAWVGAASFAVTAVVCLVSAMVPVQALGLWCRAAVCTAMLIAVVSVLEDWMRPAGLVALRGRPADSVFGPFDYHGNAASFFSLWMPSAWVWLRYASSITGRFFAGSTLGVLVIAQVVNGSEAGWILTGIFIAVLIGLVFLRWLRRYCGAVGASISVGVMLLGFAAVLSLNANRIISVLPSSLQSRALVWQQTASMASEAGAFGTGPNGYRLLMPGSPYRSVDLGRQWKLTYHQPGDAPVIWSHAHQDYLQTVVEWGWVGASLWLVLIGIGVFGLVRAAVMRRDHGGADPVSWEAGLLGGLLLLGLHAAGDFPWQLPVLQWQVAAIIGLGFGLWKKGQKSFTIGCSVLRDGHSGITSEVNQSEQSL